MGDTLAFYQAASAVCFVLVGLWWAAVTNLTHQLLHTPRHRRIAATVHYWFLLPGLMSLGATLTGESKLLWRSVFVIAAGAGALLSGFSIAGAPSFVRDGLLVRYSRPAMVAVYIAILIIAVRPELPRDVGLDTITPLQVEGLLICVLVFLGSGVAWDLVLAAVRDTPAQQGGASRAA